MKLFIVKWGSGDLTRWTLAVAENSDRAWDQVEKICKDASLIGSQSSLDWDETIIGVALSDDVDRRYYAGVVTFYVKLALEIRTALNLETDLGALEEWVVAWCKPRYNTRADGDALADFGPGLAFIDELGREMGYTQNPLHPLQRLKRFIVKKGSTIPIDSKHMTVCLSGGEMPDSFDTMDEAEDFIIMQIF